MGIPISRTCVVKPDSELNHSNENNNFTKKDLILINSTWKILEKDLRGIGIKFFIKIFNKFPHLRSRYPFANGEKTCDKTTLMKDYEFCSHAERFMQAIGYAIQKIRRTQHDMDVENDLKRIGQLHVKMKEFSKKDFAHFEDLMNELWKAELKENYTKEIENSWKQLFKFLVFYVMKGYYEHQSKTNNSN